MEHAVPVVCAADHAGPAPPHLTPANQAHGEVHLQCQVEVPSNYFYVPVYSTFFDCTISVAEVPSFSSAPPFWPLWHMSK